MSENTAKATTASAQAGAVELDILLDVQHLTKRFAADTRTSSARGPPTWAVDDVSRPQERRSAWWANRTAAKPP